MRGRDNHCFRTHCNVLLSLLMRVPQPSPSRVWGAEKTNVRLPEPVLVRLLEKLILRTFCSSERTVYRTSTRSKCEMWLYYISMKTRTQHTPTETTRYINFILKEVTDQGLLRVLKTSLNEVRFWSEEVPKGAKRE